MRKLISPISLIILTIISFNSFGQNGTTLFQDQDYRRAKVALERESASDPSLLLTLAQCHFALQEFDQAITALELYIANDLNADKTLAENWLELLKRNDEKVMVNNLGSTINSENNDFIPRILQDGKTLYFLSESRTGGVGGEDIWYSTKDQSGNWTAPNNFSKLNTTSHEGILAISPDGNVAIVFGNYTGSFGGGDLFYSVRQDDSWTPPCNLGGTINSGNWESLACIGSDGRTLIYCTDKGDGRGSDLWMTRLSETGWSAPLNLGKTINSSGEEKYPFLSADGKTLYFSSDGHFGFGGSDIFVSRRLDDSWTNWSEPVNLGKYINTLEDDQDLSIPASGKKAYIVRSNTIDGYGGKDIYEFLMPFDMRPEQLFRLYGHVWNEKDSGVQVNIRFVDMETQEDVTKVTSSANDGSYEAALPLNRKYLAVIDMKGYLYYSEVIDLTDPSKYRKKEYFQDKIKEQKKTLTDIRLRLNKLNMDIETLLASNSSDIKDVFEEYETALRQYRREMDRMEQLIYQAKYDWVMEESDDLSLEKDFQIQTAEVGAKFELKNIFFDLGKSTLRQESKAELNKLYEILKNSEIVIELGGHTDSIGTDQDNETLSQERVNSVRKYLTDLGIGENRIKAIGYGEKQPVASNSTEAGRQMNRRVEVKILQLVAGEEGSGEVTEEDKDRKPDEIVQIEKGNMLPVLQAAARTGGLPSGSACNNEDFYTNWTPGTTPVVNPPKSDEWWEFGDTSPITRKENIYKAFNVSLVNFKYKSVPYDNFNAWQGANLTLVSKKLNETSFEYYFSTPDQVDLAFGFSHLRMLQMKPLIGVPFNYILGIESKGFIVPDTFKQGENGNLGMHVNVPLGFRMVIPSQQQIIFAPEFIWSIGVFRTKDYLTQKTGHVRFGVTARWKLIHAGLTFHAGKNIGFVGYRVGISI